MLYGTGKRTWVLGKVDKVRKVCELAGFIEPLYHVDITSDRPLFDSYAYIQLSAPTKVPGLKKCGVVRDTLKGVVRDRFVHFTF